MKIGERILIFIFTFIVIILSFITLLIPLNVFSIDTIQRFVDGYVGNPYYAFIPFLIIIMGIGVLLIGFQKKKVRLGIIHKNDLGNLIISPKTFESAGYNALKDIKGIKDVAVEISFDDNGIEYNIDVSVLNDINIPELTVEVQNAIKNHVETLIGIPVNNVNMHIKDIVAPQTGITHLR